MLVFLIHSSPPNYSTPFSSDLTSELRKENAQFMLVFPGMFQVEKI